MRPIHFPFGSVFTLLTITTCAQTTFQKSYCPISNSSISFGICGQQTSDGGFVIGGGMADLISDFYGVHLIKTDESGDITQEQTISLEAGNFSNDFLQQTSDGGYIISNFGELAKIDENLNIQWSKTFGDNLGEYGTSVHQSSDGGYVVASDFNDNFHSGFDYFISKIDASGNSEWSNLFYKPNCQIFELGTLPTSDGGFISTGSYSESPPTEAMGEIIIIKTNASGELLWSQTMGGTDDDAGHSIIQLSTGEYVISGSTQSFGAGMKDIFLMKLSALGTVLWSKTYGGDSDDFANIVVQTENGGFLIGCSTKSLASQSEILLIKTDDNGNIIWSNTYGNVGDEGDQSGIGSSVDLAKTNDGGFYVTSFSNSVCLSSAYAIRTDSFGNTECSNSQSTVVLSTSSPIFQTNALSLSTAAGPFLDDAIVVDTIMGSQVSNCFTPLSLDETATKESLRAFPNPFSNETSIQIPNHLKNVNLTVYNSLGQTVRQIRNVSDQRILFNRDDLPQGVYFIQLNMQDDAVILREELIITD